MNSALETWFVQNIVLQGVSCGLEWEVEGLSDQVVVYLELGELNAEIIDGLKARGNKVVICQMGDEFKSKFNGALYEKSDLILRNYYFDDIFVDQRWADKILWIPNGYKSGVGPRDPGLLRKSSQRRFLATFLGWLDNSISFGNERALFRRIAEGSPQDILLQPTAYFGKGYNVGMYSAVMEYSVFCPCPAGNSSETIRLYDALELGCIPISLAHPFLSSENALSDPPFPILTTWDELPEFLATQRVLISANPQSIVQAQEACLQWWTMYKRQMSSTVARRLFDLRIN